MTNLSQAQPITSDESLSTKVTTSDNRNFTITGGIKAESNLFHSFNRFSVPDGGSVSFKNSSSVRNIITRVTGGSSSNINGLIKARGSANLFLINPNGIIFGPSASLQIGGSFMASTASSLLFDDGTLFAANNTQSSPLLTINTPVGLQFGETAKEIRNRSQAKQIIPGGFPEPVPVGLQVKPSKTLALVGGNVFIEGGILTAPEGRIELASVAGSSLVRLNSITEGWSIDYDDVQNFQDLQIQTTALIDTTGDNSGGVIHLQGRQIAITKGSQVSAFTIGETPGKITLKASESVEVSDGSQIDSLSFSDAAAGEIAIETKQLFVRNRSFIGTIGLATGQGGNITIDAYDLVEVNGNGFLTQLTTQTFGDGDAGNIKVATRNLVIRDGGQITSSSFGQGGGTVTINVSETVEISGQTMGGSFPSASSGVFAESDTALGNAGNLSIVTDELIVRDGAVVSVSDIEEGGAGNLNVNADSIRLNNGGTLEADTSADEGNIRLRAEDIILIDNSNIKTNATGEASGGNIEIFTDVLAALENSEISANAVQGRGGNVRIMTEALFRSPDSQITAASERGPQFDGVVEINTPDADPEQELVELPQEVVNVARLIDQNLCTASEGSEFTIAGRGGLPPSPYRSLESNDIQVEWVALNSDVRSQGDEENQSVVSNKVGAVNNAVPQSSTPNRIIEAQGWIVGDNGNVILTAEAPAVTPHSSWQKPVECSG